MWLCGKTKGKVLKVPGEKSSRFIECLRKMEMDGPESSFYDYAKEWIAAKTVSI